MVIVEYHLIVVTLSLLSVNTLYDVLCMHMFHGMDHPKVIHWCFHLHSLEMRLGFSSWPSTHGLVSNARYLYETSPCH